MAQSGSPFLFSEYLDGGDGRIALEIYNSSYEWAEGYELEMHRYVTATNQRNVTRIPLFNSGPSMTYILINSTFYDFFDITNAYYYNDEMFVYGNGVFPVAFVLKKNGQVMDVIGDPTGTGPTPIFTNGGTIIRKQGIVTGSQSYQLQGEWDRYPSGAFQYIGRHTP
ncbi:hypothetical protein BLL40_10015 [Domibacillus mangrovi]|uniref:LTD domain-containing protein n=2 Tax=Domibacillus mangrovi TaxID=1714354 RepID=A0A1Q5P2F6_9BACI|nr:hypothetical protein BLL40_10015 [Domibacillus mangrovi]